MAEQFRTTVHDLTEPDMCCPRCGNTYTPVEYYTGKKVSATSERVYNTVFTETSYQNVHKHTGGICRYCDAEKQKRMLRKLILIGTAGIVLIVVGTMILTGGIPLLKPNGLGILLVIIGFMAFIIGVSAIAIRAKMDPASDLNDISLCTMFFDRLENEGGKINGLEYLSAKDVERGWRF